MSQLDRRAYRSVYLITYSQADLHVAPSREAFSRLVINSIESATPAKPIHWICSKETHADRGVHYHMAIKLDRQQRWLAIRDRLHIVEGIAVNFSADYPDYYGAWQYTTKADEDPLLSTGHPDLTNAVPRTAAAIRARRNRRPNHANHANEEEPPPKKAKRLRALDIGNIVTTKGIKSYLEMMALSKIQKDEGKMDLYEYLLTKGSLCPLS